MAGSAVHTQIAQCMADLKGLNEQVALVKGQVAQLMRKSGLAPAPTGTQASVPVDLAGLRDEVVAMRTEMARRDEEIRKEFEAVRSSLAGLCGWQVITTTNERDLVELKDEVRSIRDELAVLREARGLRAARTEPGTLGGGSSDAQLRQEVTDLRMQVAGLCEWRAQAPSLNELWSMRRGMRSSGSDGSSSEDEDPCAAAERRVDQSLSDGAVPSLLKERAADVPRSCAEQADDIPGDMGLAEEAVPSDAEACMRLYLSVNRARSVAAMRVAAESGNVEAMVRYGYLLEMGCGVACDANGALTWYRRAAAAGSEAGKAALSMWTLRFGGGNRTLIVDGAKMASESAAAGCALGMWAWGWRLALGRGVRGNEAAAAAWFRKGAAQGEPAAMDSYAWKLYHGWGVPENKKEAMSWALKAAELGESSAMVRCAKWSSDEAESERWWKAAAECGNLEAKLKARAGRTMHMHRRHPPHP